mgnify:CR=1 FL=1
MPSDLRPAGFQGELVTGFPQHSEQTFLSKATQYCTHVPNPWAADRTEIPHDRETAVKLPLERFDHARRVLLKGYLSEDVFYSWSIQSSEHATTADQRWRRAVRDVIPGDKTESCGGRAHLVVEVSIRVRRSRSV